MNMILHERPTAEIAQGNTLTDPFRENNLLKTFDYVIANIPFSDKRWSTGLDAEHDPFRRFDGFGIPPHKQGDYAYLLHIVASLKPNGTGTCILPHGVLFRGGNEAEIRENLIRRRYIAGIIGLPPNLFYGTGIPACIVVVDKSGAAAREGVFMIDASAGFMKDGPKNRLRAQDIHKIVDVFTRRLELSKYSRMVPFAEIEKIGFNLNIPRYIGGQVPEDVQDIDAHLNGGIPVAEIDALGRYWTVCADLRKALFKPNRPGYVDLAVENTTIKTTIQEHSQFKAFVADMNVHFAAWCSKTVVRLNALKPGFHPKDLIKEISEELLVHYSSNPLIDPYAVYQHLMDYWTETMQDDCYLISADGWKAETQRIIETNKKGQTKDKGWICELIPKEYVIRRYFAEQQAAIEDLNATLEETLARRNELEQEHTVEGAALDIGPVNRTNVSVRLKEIANDKEAGDEREILESWLKLSDEESVLKKQIKDAESDLDARTYQKYSMLSQGDIKLLVIEDKWIGAVGTAIQDEITGVSMRLADKLTRLHERYALNLSQIATNVQHYEERVSRHLTAMGYSWV